MTPDELRAEVERLTRELQVERCGVRPIDELLQRVTTDRDELHVAWKREREEVERLTRERDSARDRILEYTDALVERDAEIASLTAALDERDVEAERVREQYDALATERDEARAIANAAVRELNDASAQAFIREQDVRALRDAAYERGAEAMRRACIQETGIVAALEELWIGPEDE